MRLLLALTRFVFGPFRLILFTVLVITASAGQASVVFNWPSPPGWNAGTPTAGQTKTQSFTSVDPNDITVVINNIGAQAIALGPLTYDPVTAYDSACSVGATCLTAILGEKIRRRRRERNAVRGERTLRREAVGFCPSV